MVGAFRLEDQRHLYGAGNADRTAMVFGDGDGDRGINQDLFFAKGLGDNGLEVGREEADALDALFQHGEAEEAVGADANGAAQLWRVVNGDCDKVVESDSLGGQVGAELRSSGALLGKKPHQQKSLCQENSRKE